MHLRHGHVSTLRLAATGLVRFDEVLAKTCMVDGADHQHATGVHQLGMG
jgi:hypothetical protein